MIALVAEASALVVAGAPPWAAAQAPPVHRGSPALLRNSPICDVRRQGSPWLYRWCRRCRSRRGGRSSARSRLRRGRRRCLGTGRPSAEAPPMPLQLTPPDGMCHWPSWTRRRLDLHNGCPAKIGLAGGRLDGRNVDVLNRRQGAA